MNVDILLNGVRDMLRFLAHGLLVGGILVLATAFTRAVSLSCMYNSIDKISHCSDGICVMQSVPWYNSMSVVTIDGVTPGYREAIMGSASEMQIGEIVAYRFLLADFHVVLSPAGGVVAIVPTGE